MIDEPLEFLISQYLDGTLSLEEQAALEVRLERDPAARQALDEYRQLDAVLKSSLPLPEVKWDALAEHLSQVVAAASIKVMAVVPAALPPADGEHTDSEYAVAGRIGAAGGERFGLSPSPRSLRWVRHASRLAVAACVLLATGLGIHAWLNGNGSHSTIGPTMQQGYAQVQILPPQSAGTGTTAVANAGPLNVNPAIPAGTGGEAIVNVEGPPAANNTEVAVTITAPAGVANQRAWAAADGILLQRPTFSLAVGADENGPSVVAAGDADSQDFQDPRGMPY